MPRLLRPDVEAAAPGRLRALQETRLRELLPAASRSRLYQDRWHAAGVEPGSIRTLEAFRRLPFITGADLRAVWTHPVDQVLVDPAVRLWCATSGTTGAPKWTPYGRGELAMFEEIVLRVYHMIAPERGVFRCAIFGTPAPFVSDAAAFALLASHVSAGLPVEYVVTAPTDASRALEFLAAHPPTAVVGFPSLLMRIAEGITQEAPAQARARWTRRPSVRALAGVVATRAMRIQPRHIFRPQVGLFGGEPLAPYRRPLREAWGLAPYELYAMTEFPCFHVECPEEAGIHVWADWCVPELIPQPALDREEQEGGLPEAVHLFDAPPGTVGEFVVTGFGRTLPLVRYRTGDVVEVIGTERCGCGRTHPRVRVRGRRDDLVNLGLIRFSTGEVERRLGALAGLTTWQLRIGRQGYKPHPVLLMVSGVPDAAAVAEAARAALLSIDVLRIGVENGLVAPPDVRPVEAIAEVRTWSGKRRRVIQEAEG